MNHTQVNNPMLHPWRGLAHRDPVEAPYADTSAAERHLMVTALQACERGEPEAVMLSAINLSGRKVTIRAKDLCDGLDPAELFGALVLASKSSDITVRLHAQALLAGACDEFARGWAE